VASRLLHHDHAAAQDVVQETVQRAWRHPEVLTATPPLLRAWLLKVARNIVVDRIRAADATRQRETSAAQDPTNAVGEVAGRRRGRRTGSASHPRAAPLPGAGRAPGDAVLMSTVA
jgi:DNA-directed RNA polymerase specialized sigma24 family protein